MSDAAIKRSIGVSIFAVLTMLGGVFQLLRGIGMLARGAPQGPLVTAIGVSAAVAFGAAMIAAGAGCWQLRSWGRRLMIGLSVVSCVIGTLVTLAVILGLARGLMAGTPLAGTVLIVFVVMVWVVYPGVMIWFFRRPSVTMQFGVSEGG